MPAGASSTRREPRGYPIGQPRECDGYAMATQPHTQERPPVDRRPCMKWLTGPVACMACLLRSHCPFWPDVYKRRLEQEEEPTWPIKS